MDRILSCVEKGYIPIITKGYTRVAELGEVMYIDRLDGCTVMHTRKEEFRVNVKMKDLAEALEGTPRFFACHSQLIINLDLVRHMENGYIWFEGGGTVYLGIHSFTRARKRFNDYITNGN